MAERDASEATPLHADDSPEMGNQPSPPEERVSSSTDQQSSDVASSSEQQITSSSDQDPPDSAGPSSRLSQLERILLESNEAEPVEDQNAPDVLPEFEGQPQPNNLSRSVLRGLLEAAPRYPQIDVPVDAIVGEAVVQAGLVRAAVASPLAQAAIRDASVQTAGVEQSRPSQDGTKKTTQDVEEISDDSNQQFDIDSSPLSKSSPENVDLESEGAGEEQDLGSSTLEDSGYSNQQFDVDDSSSASKYSPENVDLECDSSKQGGGEQSSGSGNTEDADLKSESSSSGTAMVKGGAGASFTTDFVLDRKSGTGIEKGGSGSSGMVRRRDILMSPKRKSPTKIQHLSPKRCAQFPSLKGASTMVSVLERLEIEETDDEMGSLPDLCPIEESRMEEQTDESEKDKNAEQEDNIEEQNSDDSSEEEHTENPPNDS